MLVSAALLGAVLLALDGPAAAVMYGRLGASRYGGTT
jgi:hypothetical protein